MSDHLPECPLKAIMETPVLWRRLFPDCICDGLRACEERVLDAAREAVEAVENDPDAEVDYDRDYAAEPTGNCRNPRIWLRSALAAIDALRGES